MSAGAVQETSLRLARLESTRLAWAFGISLALHLFCYGSYELGKRYGIWQTLHWPDWMQKARILALIAPQPKTPLPREQEAPLMFVDVNPHAAATEPPKNAKYYSDKNSQAANPDADRDTGNPKITGSQTDIVKAEDVPRSEFDRLRPAFPQAEREQQAEQPKPKSPKPVGDLAMAKPDVTLRQDSGTAERSRPRTIKEALMRQNRNQLVGQKMKLDGGVSRLRLDPGFDVRATPFGVYDAAFIEAVESRWFALLDQISYDSYRHGKVMLEFHLNYDGQITDMKVVEENVGTMLSLMCEKAVRDPAPYDRWPREMRLMVDKDYREIRFTFYYN
jgi:hypothetical protein